ncbi:hypothetical protein CRE_19198 [Caenorhabditis remanei]|uniref:Uncharacterized protein n=1 Tax=Caenorhabditis remanei TaxID=31234 RepID=E3MJD4_CAERE|nr:hypothetical protein CRE_19198 [Caenorhabditis remanei]
MNNQVGPRHAVPTLSAVVQPGSFRVFISKKKTYTSVCCCGVKRRTALMVLITFLALGLVAIVGAGAGLIGRV